MNRVWFVLGVVAVGALRLLQTREEVGLVRTVGTGSHESPVKVPSLRPIHIERKRNFSLMFVVYSLIFCSCSFIFFAFASLFAWCE